MGTVLILATGCASDPEPPAPPVPPDLVWHTELGELADDVWVDAVLDAEFAHAWALNESNFTLPMLEETTDAGLISDFAARAEGALLRGNHYVLLGPQPFLPLAVVAEDDRTALVAGCVDAPQRQPAQDDGNDWPLPRYYRVRLEEDGHRRVRGAFPGEPLVLSDGRELDVDYCHEATLPRAVFDPPPDLVEFSTREPDDLVGPPEPTDPGP